MYIFFNETQEGWETGAYRLTKILLVLRIIVVIVRVMVTVRQQSYYE